MPSKPSFRKLGASAGLGVILIWALVACQVRSLPDPTTITPAANAAPSIVAYFGDEPITQTQWQQARSYAQATLLMLGEPDSQLDERSVFQSFIEDLMLERAASKASYHVSETDIANEQAQILQVAGADENRLAEILAQVGLSRDGWTTELRRSVLAGGYLEDEVLGGVPASQRNDRRRAFLQSLRSEYRLQTLFLPAPLPGPQVGNTAPDFDLRTLGQSNIRLSELRGQGVILNFWATWCVPCRTEMPLLQKTYAEQRQHGLVVLGIDVGEDAAAVQAFVQQLGLTFPVGLDAQQSVTRQYRVYGMPTTFFINRQGVIDFLAIGPIDQRLLDRELPAILTPIESFDQTPSSEESNAP